MYGATQNIYCGLNDFEDMGFLTHFLRPEDLFFDVGANVGAYTVLASAAAGAQTCAFEPSPTALVPLRMNIAVNEIDARVQVEPVAVGRVSGEIAFALEGASAMHRVATGNGATSTRVAMRSLDCYGLRPAVIKIDVEGYETEVLEGAETCVSQPELVAVLAESNEDSRNYGSGTRSVAEFLGRHGFQAVSYDPWRRTLGPKKTRTDNTLFVRDLGKAQQRVRDARPFRIYDQAF